MAKQPHGRPSLVIKRAVTQHSQESRRTWMSRHNASRRGRLLGLAMAGMLATFAPSMEIRAQGNMKQMEGMGDTKQTATASATGTVAAVSAASHRITVNHGPIPEIKMPAMRMEFPVVSSLDLSKVKVGDKVRFTLSGSGNSYTVQSITPAP